MRSVLKALAVAAVLAGAAATVPSSLARTDADRPGGNGAKDSRKLAEKCAVAAVQSGAYTGLSAADLAAYCVELAVTVRNADYSAP